jgi:prephenate dehydrogenase
VIGRLAVFGVGLIGGSVALALKAKGSVGEVIGFDRSQAVLHEARSLGVVDSHAPQYVASVAGCDVILLAVPVGQSGLILEAIAPHLAPNTLVTDVGSTKDDIIGTARRALGEKIGQFVPGHPLAGGEKHGPKAAHADLFLGKKTVLTPLAENTSEFVERATHLWEDCGASVVVLESAAHDAALASVSHLPHLLAYALVAQVARSSDALLKMSLAGSGFRDFTRIAASSPEMWCDIALANRKQLLAELEAYEGLLASLRTRLLAEDRDALFALFDEASRTRSDWESRQ